MWPLCLTHCKLKNIILILKSDYGSFLSRITSEGNVCTFVQAQMCQSRSVPSSTKTQQSMIGKCNSREITSCQFVYNPLGLTYVPQTYSINNSTQANQSVTNGFLTKTKYFGIRFVSDTIRHPMIVLRQSYALVHNSLTPPSATSVYIAQHYPRHIEYISFH